MRRGHNNKRIKQTTQDTDGSSPRGSEEATHHQVIHTHQTTQKAAVLAAEILPLLLVVAIPLSVQAGVFSSLLGMFETTNVIADTIDPIPQSASTVRLLSASNNPDPKAALGGGDIIVDDGALLSGGPFGSDLIDQSESSGEISVYVVRSGDTLSQIAEMFDVTSNTILWANDLASASAIHPGDTLVILPIVGVRHVIKSGDTISTIAKKYEGDTDEILAFNQLTSSDELSIGDTLVIPGGNMHSAAPKRVAQRKVTPTSVSGNVSGSSALSHPLPGAIRTQGIHGYNGVDLAAPNGTPIRAAATGEVIVSKGSGYNGGYGNYIVIKHANGTQTLYSHLSKNYVGVGAFVGVGETIGAVGSTGRSTGDHLHFEVRGATNPF